VSAGVSDDSLKFTAEELTLFERQYQEGYDIVDDSKYNACMVQKFLCKELKDSLDDLCHCQKDKDAKSNTVYMLKPIKCT